MNLMQKIFAVLGDFSNQKIVNYGRRGSASIDTIWWVIFTNFASIGKNLFNMRMLALAKFISCKTHLSYGIII